MKQQSANNETHVVISGYNEYSKIIVRIITGQTVSFLHISENSRNKSLKDAAVCCRIIHQAYEYYTEYFTHKVKYFSL